ncbi:hypothetical protein EDD22DRAFT_215692 [Suillus occidentalis]|nr:hypothetical protein EDD22DRAFT_215692 [Suillus occidentalis]
MVQASSYSKHLQYVIGRESLWRSKITGGCSNSKQHVSLILHRPIRYQSSSAFKNLSVNRFLDTKARSQVIVVYFLLVADESEILVCVLYRTFESHGSWKIENRLMRGLMHHNLLYFSCSFGSCLNHFPNIHSLVKWHRFLSCSHPRYSIPSGKPLCMLKAAPVTRDGVSGGAHDCRVCLISLGGNGCLFGNRTEVVVLSLSWSRECTGTFGDWIAFCDNDLSHRTSMAATADM